jgi:uncharacterized protein (DUF427 family)
MSQVQEPSPLRIEPDPRRIQVMFGGHDIADSRNAVVVHEAGLPPVWYFPRHDVEMAVLGQTSRVTTSPTKGIARWLTLNRDAHVVENAIWSFEAPPLGFEGIAGRIAFEPVQFEFAADGQSAADWDVAADPGRLAGLDPDVTAFATVRALADAMRRAAAAHHGHEQRTGAADPNWPDWYARFIAAEQAAQDLPT